MEKNCLKLLDYEQKLKETRLKTIFHQNLKLSI